MCKDKLQAARKLHVLENVGGMGLPPRFGYRYLAAAKTLCHSSVAPAEEIPGLLHARQMPHEEPYRRIARAVQDALES